MFTFAIILMMSILVWFIIGLYRLKYRKTFKVFAYAKQLSQVVFIVALIDLKAVTTNIPNSMRVILLAVNVTRWQR